MAKHGVALTLVVDERGFVLLQHRDEHARVAPGKWALPGGQIEPGETPLEAAHRELFEETGLTLDELKPLWSGPIANGVMTHAFSGSTAATQEDVVLGEGQAMVFTDPREIPKLDRVPWVDALLKALIHDVQSDVTQRRVVKRLRDGGQDLETQ